MTPEEHDRLIDAIPDDMVIWESAYGYDWSEWRTMLGHSYREGSGHCHTCGPAVSCLLLVFKDALTTGVVRELDTLGVLSPLGGEGCTHGDTVFDRIPCPEPCGCMHTYCTRCRRAVEPPCAFGDLMPSEG